MRRKLWSPFSVLVSSKRLKEGSGWGAQRLLRALPSHFILRCLRLAFLKILLFYFLCLPLPAPRLLSSFPLTLCSSRSLQFSGGLHHAWDAWTELEDFISSHFQVHLLHVRMAPVPTPCARYRLATHLLGQAREVEGRSRTPETTLGWQSVVHVSPPFLTARRCSWSFDYFHFFHCSQHGQPSLQSVGDIWSPVHLLAVEIFSHPAVNVQELSWTGQQVAWLNSLISQRELSSNFPT